jgi:hypothetical protein
MRQNIKLILVAMIIFAPLSVSMVQAEEADKTFLLSKIEANLWESTAAVFFHIADSARGDRRIALNDYNDDMETIERNISLLEKIKLSEKEASALADIKKGWKTVKTKSDALINNDFEKDKNAPLEMHDFWLEVEELDNKIDEFIEKVRR